MSIVTLIGGRGLDPRLWGPACLCGALAVVVGLAGSPAGASTPKVGGDSWLNAVAATSRSNAWAVGAYDLTPDARTPRVSQLIKHWNGHRWSVQHTPATASSELHGVTATSERNAWAVGSGGTSGAPLVEHWDGKSWSVQTSPKPPGGLASELSAVSATSARNAWAVGEHFLNANGHAQTLIEHWNGTSWTIQSSPNPAGRGFNYLFAVVATSKTNAWAVGYSTRSRADSQAHSLIEHWDGRRWRVEKAPDLGPLHGLAAPSRSDAWAAGCPLDSQYGCRLDHWNGTHWKRQSSETSGWSIAASSRSNAWVTGYHGVCLHRRSCREDWVRTWTTHWDGRTWRFVKSPNAIGGRHDNLLLAGATTSKSDAWAVGYYTSNGRYTLGQCGYSGTVCHPLIEHWNGHAWKVV